MATIEHCLYCFEVLEAHLEEREPMGLADLQKSWATYAAGTTGRDDEASSAVVAPSATHKLAKQIPALRRLVGGGSGSGGSSSDSSSSSSSVSDSSSSGSNSSRSISGSASGISSSATSSTTSLPADTAATTPNRALTPATSATPPPPPLTESPLFVTWNTLSSRHGSTLRGCIGTFESQPLEEGLSSYAITSALHDTRFTPVRRRELPSLEVAVTLLTDFEDAADADDWELGTHGLRISFYHGGRRYGSTYLPDVAPEQGWTKEETVMSLMRKAGWMGRKDKWREVDLKVVRYQGKKVDLEYAEYKRWRDWADKQADDDDNEEEEEKEGEAGDGGEVVAINGAA